MSSRKLAEFPEAEAKLHKPTKKSAFERQKAEAEAKRQREAAETAAVYEDFVKSFDRDDGYNGTPQRRPSPNRFDRQGGLGGQPPFGAGPGKRHFGIPSTPSGLKGGPGSLGPPPSSFGRKKPYDGFNDKRDRDDSRGRLGFDDHEPSAISRAFDASDDEGDNTASGRAEEKAISKPTLRLANLPPGTSPAVIKALIPPNLTVENVKLQPPAGPGTNDRKSTAAIVTLSKETAATDMDAAVSALQNRYLGFGHYLSLHRHLSSAAISGSLTSVTTTTTASQPFGAKPVPQSSVNEGPPHMSHGRGFAPPSSYGPPGNGPVNRSGILHVPIQPPRDIKKLRMIHKVIEAILEHGPDFEALLMTRADVQRDEKWAWIWDARSEGGVWYRYRMWEIITGSTPKKGQGKFLPLFEGFHAWKMPDQPLPFEYKTHVDEFVSDSEYNSSDDDDFDDEPNKPAETGGTEQEDTFLNPLDKSKLAHLLARLPPTLTKLRTGDIARVTTFAITHASRGADEIVDMIISNIERPFSHTRVNPEYKVESKDKEDRPSSSREGSPGPGDKGSSESQDTSGASLIGLYVVSDLLSSSSTSGVRHAWRYRQLFEAGLQARKVFEGLGLLAEKLRWGRLRAEKWKRSVKLILNHWEGWCVFPAETQEFLVNSFENPPTLKKEEVVEDDSTRKGKWKTSDVSAAKTSGFQPVQQEAPDARPRLGDGSNAQLGVEDSNEPAEDDSGLYVEYTDDEDLDLECLEEEDIDGEPLLQSGVVGLSIVEAEADGPDRAVNTKVKSAGGFQMASTPAAAAVSRKRMRAVDMFADSDSEGEE